MAEPPKVEPTSPSHPSESVVVMCDPLDSQTPAPKKRVFIHRQAREMAKKTMDFCVEERKNKCLYIPINDAMGRASAYTGLAKRTLHAINKEAKAGALRTPSKKGITCNKNKNINVENIDRSVIHEIIEELYMMDKVIPTCAKLQAAIRQKMEFPWSLTTVRKLLKEMGYQWLKSQNKKRILSEKPAITFSRASYIREMKDFRREEKKIVFVGETWIDHELTYKKCWKTETVDAVFTDDCCTNKIFVIHAGTKEGFLDGTKMVFEADGKKTDGHMNSVVFEKWVVEKLVPNLPPNSVVVMNNASYHTVQENKVPTKSSTKLVMIEWLNKMNMNVTLDMRKDQLYRLIEFTRPIGKIYRIDEYLKQYGHVVLRLPQYMCDMNPIEMAWEKLNKLLREINVNTDGFSLADLKKVTEAALDQITNDDWRRFDSHVMYLEEHHWERDVIIENITDKFVAEVSEDEESDADSDMSVLIETDDEAY